MQIDICFYVAPLTRSVCVAVLALSIVCSVCMRFLPLFVWSISASNFVIIFCWIRIVRSLSSSWLCLICRRTVNPKIEQNKYEKKKILIISHFRYNIHEPLKRKNKNNQVIQQEQVNKFGHSFFFRKKMIFFFLKSKQKLAREANLLPIQIKSLIVCRFTFYAVFFFQFFFYFSFVGVCYKSMACYIWNCYTTYGTQLFRLIKHRKSFFFRFRLKNQLKWQN